MRGLVAFTLALMLTASASGSPAPVQAQPGSLRDLLPGYPEGGSTVIVTNEGIRTCDEYAAIFFDAEEAARLLADWGCQENVFRVYEDTEAVGNGTERPYLQVGVTRFASAIGASAALPYIVQNLRPAGAHREIPMASSIGDESRQFVADVEGGMNLTLLARSDSLLIGVSTLLTEGDPVFDPIQEVEAIIARQAMPPTPTPTGMTAHWWDLAPLLDALPPDLPSCLRLTEDEPLDFATMATRFPGTPDAAAQLQELGWQAGRHRQFECDPLPAAGLNWLDMSVHLFQDAPSAAAAVPFFAHARTVGTQLVPQPATRLGDTTAAIAGPSENGTEYTLYLSRGPLLFRVSAIAAEDAPQADVEYVMTALYGNALGDDQEPPNGETPGPVATVTRVPIIPSPTPTQPPPPTPTAIAVPTVPPPVPTSLPPQGNCDPSYSGVCIPPVWEVGDLDCRDVPYGSFRVIGDDPHNFDGPYDGSVPNEPDGIGCEWN